MAGDATEAGMVLLPAAPTAKAPGDRFTGDVWVDTVTSGARPGDARLATVRFSPCARTAWHRHARGQTLHITDDVGVVQEKDGQLIRARARDTIYTPPGVWHWHGALPGQFMTHLALADSSDDPAVLDVEWGELVSDAEYDVATTTTGRSPR